MSDSKKELEQISLRDLRLIWTICSEGSISKAAKTLGVSQPTASYGVDKLRTIFSDPLFERRQNRLFPTELCENLAAVGMRVINELAGLTSQAFFEPSNSRRKFTVLCRNSDLHLYEAISEAFFQSAPLASLEVRATDENNIVSALHQGVDAYVGSTIEPAPGIEITKIQSYGVDMIFNPELLEPPASLEDVPKFKYAISWAPLLKDRLAFGKIDRALLAAGLPVRQISLSTMSLRKIANTIRSNPIIFTGSRFSLPSDFEGLVHHPVPFETPPFEMSVAWSSAKGREAPNQWFNKLLIKVTSAEFDATDGHWVTTPYRKA